MSPYPVKPGRPAKQRGELSATRRHASKMLASSKVFALVTQGPDGTSEIMAYGSSVELQRLLKEGLKYVSDNDA